MVLALALGAARGAAGAVVSGSISSPSSWSYLTRCGGLLVFIKFGFNLECNAQAVPAADFVSRQRL